MGQFGRHVWKMGQICKLPFGPSQSPQYNVAEKAPEERSGLGTGDSPASQPCPSLSEQSEEDIDVLAFGKQQPKNIANPLYETSAPAPPESSCDPFTVSLHFTLGVQNAAFQQTLGELPRGKSSLLECVSDSKPGSHFSVQNAHLSGRRHKPQTRGCLSSTVWRVGEGK